ncbi:MAG: hypothetical protein ABI218_07550 [Caldimonas sp.]
MKVMNFANADGKRYMNRTQGDPVWSTSSLEGNAEQTPADLDALAAQMGLCNEDRGRFFVLQSAVEEADSLARARFVTTILVATLTVAAIWLFF